RRRQVTATCQGRGPLPGLFQGAGHAWDGRVVRASRRKVPTSFRLTTSGGAATLVWWPRPIAHGEQHQRLRTVGTFPRAARPDRPAHRDRGGAIMATVREILSRKGSHVFTIGREATVLAAATLMNEHKIGALVVVEDGRVVGMFT